MPNRCGWLGPLRSVSWPAKASSCQGPSHSNTGQLDAMGLSFRQPSAGTGCAPPSRIRLPVHNGPQWRRSTEA